MSTICMKIDPGMHIGLHLVFFGKIGVTSMSTRLLSSEMPPSYYSTAGDSHIMSAGRIASEP
jgi:hypothetical protein